MVTIIPIILVIPNMNLEYLDSSVPLINKDMSNIICNNANRRIILWMRKKRLSSKLNKLFSGIINKRGYSIIPAARIYIHTSLSLGDIRYGSCNRDKKYVVAIILIPGCISLLFFSNLYNWKYLIVPHTTEMVTLIRQHAK